MMIFVKGILCHLQHFAYEVRGPTTAVDHNNGYLFLGPLSYLNHRCQATWGLFSQ